MAEELIYKVGVEGTNELDKLETSVDKAGKSTNKTRLYMSELRTELRKARGDMIKYAEGTEEYNAALAKGARITQQINDANSKMRAGVQDLGTTTKNVTGALTGFAGGFQVVQSTMSLFGIENEETIKTVLKLQQTMSIVQGLSAFAQGISDAQDILSAFRQSNNRLNEDLKESSQNMEGVTSSSDKMGDSFKVSGKESAVLSSNLAGATNAADETSKGMNNLMTSLSESGGFFDRFKKAAAKANVAMLENDLAILKSGEDFESLNAVTNKVIEANGGHEESIESIITAMEKEIALNKSTIEGLNQKTESLEKTTKATDNLSKGVKESGKAVNSFAKTIGKSLLTMGAFLAVIALVTWGISELIKLMAKIPEDVKIDIEIKETVSQQIAKDQIAVRKFANDYRKAWKDNDDKRLEGMAKIAKEEYNMSDERLKLITDTEDGWKEAFKEYLKIAEETYRAEAIIKMRVDAELKAETEMFAAEEKFMAKTGNERDKVTGKANLEGSVRSGLEVLDWEKMKAIAEEGGISGKMWDIFDLWGVPQEIVDHLRAVNAANAIIKNLPEINFKDLDFNTGNKTTTTTTTTDVRTSPGKAPTFGDRRPDAVEDDLEIQFMKARNIVVKELTNEELVTLAENLRKKDTLQDDSLIKYTEYQIKLGEARAKDLNNLKESLEEGLAKTEQVYGEELEFQNKKLEDTKVAHNLQLENLREFNTVKFELEAQAAKLLEERQGLDGETDKARIKAIDEEIAKLNQLYAANNDRISQTKEIVANYKEEVKAIEAQLTLLDNTPEEIARMKDEITQLNLAIADNSAFLVDSLAANMQAMLDNVGRYTQEMGIIFSDLENMSNAQMQTADNRTAKEKNNLELSQAYREADSEQQQQMMYELDLANYNSKKKAFEANKKFQMGQVVIQSASNQIDIIKAWLDPKTGGPLSPANIAISAAATAANIATTIASLKQISSTTLDKPVPPIGGSGSGLGSANIALSPHKTSLTSKEENLNSMYRSSMGESENTIVKVSEINNVQKRVQVREKNSSY